MIYRKQQQTPDVRKPAAIGGLLFVISLVLLVLTGPLGFLYGLLHSLLSRGFRGVGEYLLQLAVSIDQLGNVLMQHLLSGLWIKTGGYPFGNRDETISSALGRNKREGTLTAFGRAIDALLDRIDPNHSLNSIDYYIEPTSRIIEAVCWLQLEAGKALCTRSRGHAAYLIPGGKRQAWESEHQALMREIREELGVELEAGTLRQLGIFEAQADGQPPGMLVRLSCYEGAFTGQPVPSAEVVELVWLGYADRQLVAPADQLIFDLLYQQGRLL
jgi:8-oxo-dGTP pyrophosphatase MutT (NUDIX family)